MSQSTLNQEQKDGRTKLSEIDGRVQVGSFGIAKARPIESWLDRTGNGDYAGSIVEMASPVSGRGKKNGEVHLEPSDLEAAKTEIRWLQQKLAQVEEERETLHLPWRAVPANKAVNIFSHSGR